MSSLYQKDGDSKRQQLLPEPDLESLAHGAIAAEELDTSVRLEQQILVQATDEASRKKTIKDLQKDLQTALDLELSTIPPYLSALYSIKEGTNREAVEIIRSVVVEEMLHMIMVSNLLNAVGGQPKVGQWTPDYPSHLPGNVMPQLVVPLDPLSKNTIRTFEKIEHPEGGLQFIKQEEEKQKIRKQHKNKLPKKYSGIGEFYAAIQKTMNRLEKEAQAKGETIFTANVNQVSNDQYYGAGGAIITVANLSDANQLIEEIVGQGEGTLGTIFAEDYDPANDKLIIFGPDVEEYAHYFRFKEIRHERFYAINDSAHRDSRNRGLPTGPRFKVEWDQVYNFRPNPKLAHYKKSSPVYQKTLEFNQTYQALLDNIHKACNGAPDELIKGITLMYDLKYKAVELMKTPLSKKDLVKGQEFEEGQTAGPSFELTDC